MDSLPGYLSRHSEFGWVRYPFRGPSPISISTSEKERRTLHVDAFRGERAITERDWLFTPIHSSSDGVAAPTGSGLQTVLPALHPGHG